MTYTQQQILRFQITMCYSRIVHTPNRREQTLRQLLCVLFGVLGLFRNSVKYIASTHVISHQIKEFFFFVKVKNLDNVFVVLRKRLHDRYFVQYEFVLTGSQFSTPDDFHGKTVSCPFVTTLMDSGARPVSKFANQFILIMKLGFGRTMESCIHDKVVHF